MATGSVARRYARALYELAVEEHSVREVGDALVAVADAITEVGLHALMPGALSAEQRAALLRALAPKLGSQATLGRFLGVMAQADRLDQLPAVGEWYRKMGDDAAGRVRIAVVSPEELSSEQIESIAAKFRTLTGRDVVPEVSVDASLMGGLTVEVEGRVYDGSVKTRLARLTARMAGEA